MLNSTNPRKVVVLHTTDTIYDALRAMANHRIGCVVVANAEGDCVGIVTDRDLAISIALDDVDLQGTSLAEVMTAPLIAASVDFSLHEVVDLMVRHNIRRVPIVEQRHNRRFAVDMVSVDDLITSQAVSLRQLAAIAQAQNNAIPRATNLKNSKERRKQARREHTYRRFINQMMGALELSRAETEQFTYLMMKNLVTRITPAEAFDFISQLPAMFHDDLLKEKAGPRRGISRASVVADTCRLLDVSHENAQQIIANFWHCLEHLMPGGELEDVLSQLPRDMQSLLLAA